MATRITLPRSARISTSPTVVPTELGEVRFEVKSAQDHVDAILATLRNATHVAAKFE